MKRSVHYSITKLCLTTVVVFSMLVFTSCENKEDGPEVVFEEEEQAAYEAEESAENLFDVVESITNSAIQLAETNAGGRIAVSDDPEIACAAVQFEGTEQSGRIEINFGEGCEGPDGRTRKGIIVVEYDGNWKIKGSKIYTILKNFYVDGFRVEGTRILTNVSLDLDSLVYTVEIIGGKITWPAEEGVEPKYLTRESDRLHTLIFGENLTDFELHVEGEASGISREGVEYSTKTVEPLVFKSSCRGNLIYIPTSGIKIITIPGKPEITINYGTGDCDKTFNIKIGEQSKDITI